MALSNEQKVCVSLAKDLFIDILITCGEMRRLSQEDAALASSYENLLHSITGTESWMILGYLRFGQDAEADRRFTQMVSALEDLKTKIKDSMEWGKMIAKAEAARAVDNANWREAVDIINK